MSGGSFNYFCFKENGEALQHLEDLRALEQYCRETGNHLAANECFRYLLFLESTKHRLEVYHERMAELLRAVEWAASGDGNETGIRYAYEELLKGKEDK